MALAKFGLFGVIIAAAVLVGRPPDGRGIMTQDGHGHVINLSSGFILAMLKDYLSTTRRTMCVAGGMTAWLTFPLGSLIWPPAPPTTQSVRKRDVPRVGGTFRFSSAFWVVCTGEGELVSQVRERWWQRPIRSSSFEGNLRCYTFMYTTSALWSLIFIPLVIFRE